MRMRLSPSMKGVTLQHIAAIATTMKMSMRGVQAPLQGWAGCGCRPSCTGT